MRRPLSLALRLTLLFGISAAIVFPIFGWVIIQSTESHFEEEDSEELEVIVVAVQELLTSQRAAYDHNLLEQRFEDILVGHHDASLYVIREDGQVVYASPSPDFSAITQSLQGGAKDNSVRPWKDPDHSYRVLTRFTDRRGVDGNAAYILTAAVPIDQHLLFLDSFRRTLWLMIAASIGFMSLMGWIAVRQGHAPLHKVVDQIHRISVDQLNTRLSPDAVPRELTELAVSFNEMLQRVDEAFHRLTDFNADIAHELRTPIANLMTQTQVSLSRARATDEYREILYSNMEEYERMAQMVGDMLYLAQADSQQQKQSVTELDLATEMRTLFDFYEGWAEERGVTLSLAGDATIDGDRHMIQRALGNLLSNAIHHTAASGTVRVVLNQSKADEISIAVENPGATIAPEHIPRLFDRFYRIDPSRQQGDQGVGLGLAIVKSIIKAHDGHIEVTSEAGHTRFRVTLPRRSARSNWEM